MVKINKSILLIGLILMLACMVAADNIQIMGEDNSDLDRSVPFTTGNTNFLIFPY